MVACGGTKFSSGAEEDGGADGSFVDGSSSDSGTSDAGGPSPDGGLGLEGGVGSCQGDAGIFDNIIKACSISAGCIVVMHQIDCCGSMAAVGINHASHDTFAADEMQWVATCPACRCVARPTIAEDGKTTTDAGAIKVECVNNVCRSYVP
jgi:hypothetical protein